MQVFRCRRQAHRKRLPKRRGPLASIEARQQIVDRGVVLQDAGQQGHRRTHPEHPGDGRQILANRLAQPHGIGVGGAVDLQRQQHDDAIDRRQRDAGLPQLVAGEFQTVSRIASFLR